MYQYIKPDRNQEALMQKFRDKFETLHAEIRKEARHTKGRSKCLNKLQEASFWLNKSITHNDAI